MQNETRLLRSARHREEAHDSSGRTRYQHLFSPVLALSLLAQLGPATAQAQPPNSPLASALAANAALALFSHRPTFNQSIQRIHQPGSDSRVEAAATVGSGLALGCGCSGQPPTLQRAPIECRRCKKHKSSKLKARSGVQAPVSDARLDHELHR